MLGNREISTLTLVLGLLCSGCGVFALIATYLWLVPEKRAEMLRKDDPTFNKLQFCYLIGFWVGAILFGALSWISNLEFYMHR